MRTIIADKKALFEGYLGRYLEGLDTSAGLQQACAYSLLAGGKRLRPMLVQLACEALGGQAAHALDAALALEMIHTFSLIHDDLPAIDNDDLRRGKPTCHKAFGEATAILAGDALIFAAFTVIGSSSYRPEVRADLMQAMAEACGWRGLIEGEYADIMAEGRSLDIAQIEAIYGKKTGKLFELALYAGGRIAGGNASELEALRSYGRHLGLAFQAVDDILDVTASSTAMGKTTGKDLLQDKATIVKVLGLEKAKTWAEQATSDAIAALNGMRGADMLIALARDMLMRIH